MNHEIFEKFSRHSRDLDLEDFLKLAVETWGDSLVLASSLGPEDQVLLYYIRNYSSVKIFTLDTGRLPGETYELLDRTQKHFGRSVEVLFPRGEEVEDLVNSKGINLFYDSIENRKACCGVRKVQPLTRRLAQAQAWMTGLRRSQAPTRAQVDRVQWDETHQIPKLSPLADWTQEDVWDVIKAQGIPVNSLHGLGYQSIGCAPCTRATAPGEDERAGRWWWESPEHKECGLHVKPTAIQVRSFGLIKE